MEPHRTALRTINSTFSVLEVRKKICSEFYQPLSEQTLGHDLNKVSRYFAKETRQSSRLAATVGPRRQPIKNWRFSFQIQKLLQLNRTQFSSLEIFVSKKVGNRKN